MKTLAFALVALGLVAPTQAQSPDPLSTITAWEEQPTLVRQEAYERIVKCAGAARAKEQLSSSESEKAQNRQEMADLVEFAVVVSGKEFFAVLPDLKAPALAYIEMLNKDLGQAMSLNADCQIVLAAARG